MAALFCQYCIAICTGCVYCTHAASCVTAVYPAAPLPPPLLPPSLLLLLPPHLDNTHMPTDQATTPVHPCSSQAWSQ
jgi:hypothetical protein